MVKEPLPKEHKEFLNTCIKKALDPVNMIIEDHIDEDTDFFNIMCRAEMNQLVFKFKNFPMTVFKSSLHGNSCIVVMLQLPFKQRSKKLSDKVMEIVGTFEHYFFTIDKKLYKSKDKFTYVLFLIKITEEVERWLRDL